MRLLGYYKIKQGILQQNLGKYYRSESADVLCEQFNKFINTLKKENVRVKWLISMVRSKQEEKYVKQRDIRKLCRLKKSCLFGFRKEESNGYVIHI